MTLPTVTAAPQAHSMSKCELAAAYAPHVAQRTAVNRLCMWIHRTPELMEALAATHYRDSQKMLTARQVSIIYQYLGEP